MKYASILIVALLLSSCNDKKEVVDKPVKEIVKPVKEEIKEEFGFILNDFSVVHDTLVSGDSFGKILGNNNLSASKIHDVNLKIKDSFDVRSIQIGKPYTLLKSKTTDSLQVFIYQPDRLKYVVIDLRDSILAYKKEVPTVLKTRTVAGRLDGSLASSLEKEGVSPSVANSLLKMYAWSIDFFKLDKGDKFAVNVTEKYLATGEKIGVESINASYIEYRGKLVYSFPYKKNSNQKNAEYFDEEGKVLKNMFLKAPLKFFRLTSKFTKQRFHPVQLKWKAHNGTDYAAPAGTPIMTTASGVVIQTGYTAGNGNFVKVKHNETYTTQYLHMSKILVRNGQRVQQGETIGKVGSTGLATGPHVCYRFWKNGVQTDPLKQKLPNSEPMSSKEKPAFLKHIEPLKRDLDSISKLKFEN